MRIVVSGFTSGVVVTRGNPCVIPIVLPKAELVVPQPVMATKINSPTPINENVATFTWMNCNRCGARIKSYLRYCPVCKKRRPFTCTSCGKHIHGPLIQGVSVVNGVARCASCINRTLTPAQLMASQLPKSTYGIYYNDHGLDYPWWYGTGYQIGFDDAKAGYIHDPDAKHHISQPNSWGRQCFLLGYADGYRAGRA